MIGAGWLAPDGWRTEIVARGLGTEIAAVARLGAQPGKIQRGWELESAL